MNKGIITLACAALLLSSCASEFNSVYKYGDTDYKYEYAKEAFACGKFQQAASLLEELVTATVATPVSVAVTRHFIPSCDSLITLEPEVTLNPTELTP